MDVAVLDNLSMAELIKRHTAMTGAYLDIDRRCRELQQSRKEAKAMLTAFRERYGPLLKAVEDLEAEHGSDA